MASFLWTKHYLIFREFANWFNRLELEKLKLITSNQTSLLLLSNKYDFLIDAIRKSYHSRIQLWVQLPNTLPNLLLSRSSGRSFPRSTASTAMASTWATVICSWSASVSTTTKHRVTLCHVIRSPKWFSLIASPFSSHAVVGWQVRAQGHPARSGARNHGVGAFRSVRTTLPAGQLRVRTVGSGQQLGQGSLHRGRRAGGQCPGRGPQGVRELRLPAGWYFQMRTS